MPRIAAASSVAVVSVVCAIAAAPSARASQADAHVLSGFSALADGELDGTSLDGNGVVRPGFTTSDIGSGLVGTVLALARGADGNLYAATTTPGRLWRIAEGKSAEVVVDFDKPLVTALLPVDAEHIAAMTAPDGGVEIVDVKTKKRESVPTKLAKMLLAGAVYDGAIYAVGGGEEGVVLKLEKGKKEWEKMATAPEQMLRSIAIAKTKSGVRIVVGGSDAGVVYELDPAAKKLRSLLDVAPGEVTAITLRDDGTAFFAAVDSEGKLSKGATAKAKEDDDGEGGDKNKKKARRVKSAEVWRLDADGRARILWQSKDQGAYALALDGNRLLFGTGPMGRVYAVDVGVNDAAAGVWLRARGHDEVTALLVEKSGLLLGAAHGAGVLKVVNVSQGSYTSPELDAGARAKIGVPSLRSKGKASLQFRSGNSREADDTWSDFVDNADKLAPAQYVQVKVTLSQGAELQELVVPFLVDNHAPEIDRVEVLAPGWKVTAAPRDAPEMRSVSFGERPFAKFLDRRGGQNPTLEERPFGKQTFDVGYRTLYTWVEDADRDAIRYRYFLGRSSAEGAVATWQLVKDWSDEPFYSFEASRFADGLYRVKVEVDDSLTSGPTRKLGDADVSPVFVVSHAAPKFSSTQASRDASGVTLKLAVQATLPLTVVRCAVGGGDWYPLDPKDGITDEAEEEFTATLPSTSAFATASCEAYDEALNFARVDITVK